MTEIVDGLEFARIYWVAGTMKRGGEYRNEVQNPPCSGWMGAVILPGEKRSTIFCPYTFEAFTVSNQSGELRGANYDVQATPHWLDGFMRKRWTEMQTRGWQKDYDTAVLIFRRLGTAIPEQILKGGEEDTRKKGGKEVEAKLTKPVKLDGKRGKFLEWFLNAGGTASIREAMAEFGMTRSNVLSYLYMLKKDHGLGYDLVGDNAVIQLPPGVTNPFDTDWECSGELPASKEDDDDSWLD